MALSSDHIPLDADMAKWTTLQLAACVHNHEEKLAQRMRAVFYLRTESGDAGVIALCDAVKDMAGSCLFRHEVAFVLGQMRNTLAIPTLTSILKNRKDDPIVRHEVRELRLSNTQHSRGNCGNEQDTRHSVYSA
jgi:deoxyhypusine monooxygenase